MRVEPSGRAPVWSDVLTEPVSRAPEWLDVLTEPVQRASVILEQISRVDFIDMPSVGTSMYPLIVEGDICRFMACVADDVRLGEVFLFMDCAGHLVAHRLLRKLTKGGQTRYQFKGDANRNPDAPVELAQILAKLVLIQKRRWLNPNQGLAWVWGEWLVAVPNTARFLQIALRLSRRLALGRREPSERN